MKRRWCYAFISLAFVIAVIGCGVKDKPLPESQANAEKYAEYLNDAFKSLPPAMSEEAQFQYAGEYKKVMEKKMGYSFDKTLRYLMLFSPGGDLRHLVAPVELMVLDNPKKALEKGIISQRTFDIVEAKKAGVELTKAWDEFIGFVVECQNQNNGVCNSQALLNILNTHNAIPPIQNNDESTKIYSIDAALNGKYDIFHMGIRNLITNPDGTKRNTNGLIMDDPSKGFIVNKQILALSKKYTEMVEEERVALSK